MLLHYQHFPGCKKKNNMQENAYLQKDTWLRAGAFHFGNKKMCSEIETKQVGNPWPSDTRLTYKEDINGWNLVTPSAQRKHRDVMASNMKKNGIVPSMCSCYPMIFCILSTYVVCEFINGRVPTQLLFCERGIWSWRPLIVTTHRLSHL